MTSTEMFSAADAVPYSNMRTVIIRWKEYQMTEATDKSVLMICEKCGYKENVPWSDLLRIRELYNLKEDDEDHVLCPLCLHDMYPADSDHFKK